MVEMQEEYNPRSVQPASRRSPFAVFQNSPTHPATPMKRDTEASEIRDESLSSSGIEARDYMNGGLPHEVHAATTDDGPSLLQGTSADGRIAPDAALSSPTATSTPSGRRGVQFAHDQSDSAAIIRAKQSMGDGGGETQERDLRGTSLMSRFKAMTMSASSPTAARVPSYGAEHSNGDTIHVSPLQNPASDSRSAKAIMEDNGDIDADAEETADEDRFTEAVRSRRKRRQFRVADTAAHNGTIPHTAYTTANGPEVEQAETTIQRIMRRSTMPENANAERAGISEGEGRERIKRQSTWKFGSPWSPSNKGQNHIGLDTAEGEAMSNASRPNNSGRRATGMSSGLSDGEAAKSPRRPFMFNERGTTFGGQKWRTLVQGMKLLGPKKPENRIDYLKSAELMAELSAGAPAALILASMIQRDEHGNKRIPVLLEQLKLNVVDSRSTDDKEDGQRHLLFDIQLEYGSGKDRMKWTIQRTLRDFVNLHLRYKLQTSSDKIQRKAEDSRPKQPRFPKSAFPYLRGFRGLGDESEEEEREPGGNDGAGAETTHSELERPVRKKRARSSIGNLRRKSSTALSDSVGGVVNGSETGAVAREADRKGAYNERQRRRLETYLQEMIRWLIFRAESNRLCRFLELSSLGIRLSAEGGYHGKEGSLVIQTAKGLDFRRVLTPHNVFARHSPKWFLVRSNYIVCVDSPENMHIYDVYLLDGKFEIQSKRGNIKNATPGDVATAAQARARHPQHHRLKILNSERKIKLLAKNERILRQFEDSIKKIMHESLWAKEHRFGSFAPVRTGVFAQWLVDGRDYMWNVSRAINEAKDVIYIHDWWLSPELYMRRPAAISQKWRLDRLLRKKAREGVKIFIIIYRNVEAAVPIDSEYTKFCLLDLHPNIFVQRSPNQFKKNQFFFAHHEKICVVDHSVAFVGGIDLCFGRWDTPQHSLTDDKPTGFEMSDDPKDADHCQLWPGKDYSNPRTLDFFNLSEPYAEMYDRAKVPRMPWHDISMQIVGQPARDLSRHFIQRWNYVLRGRKPTRPTPMLLPPPDYKDAQLEAAGMNGTCEVQILRSASLWSLGLEETEHSIMNAYCKMIEESEHFVYIENQFFITSCETMNVRIHNKIGDALVERAIRAFEQNESWRAVIVIPLMPGFQNTVDAADGTSVRLIMQCQFRSISRGEGSIFGRLKAAGIEPEDFISFYSLRSWGRIGPSKLLVSEQLYIHAKVIIVDDRIALIGSANINERSMLGVRDSECAAVVRDTDMLWSTMDGRPYLVGRFAHTLRMRLMREHLGLDVDAIMEDERSKELDREEATNEPLKMKETNATSTDLPRNKTHQNDVPHQQNDSTAAASGHQMAHSFNHDVDWEQKDNPNIKSEKNHLTSDKRVTGNKEHEAEVDGRGADNWAAAEKTGVVRGRDSLLVDGVREVLVTDIAPEGRGTLEKPRKPHHAHHTPTQQLDEDDVSESDEFLPPQPQLLRKTTEQLGLTQLSQLPALPVLDDTDIGGPPVVTDSKGHAIDPANPLLTDFRRADVSKDCMRDPLNNVFFDDTWHLVAENNTRIFRTVFRCNPDNEVTNWAEYQEFQAYGERFSKAQGGGTSQEREQQENATSKSGPPGAGSIAPHLGALGVGLTSITDKLTSHNVSVSDNHPMGTVKEWAQNAENENMARKKDSDIGDDVANEKASFSQERDEGPTTKSLPVNHEHPLTTHGAPPSRATAEATASSEFGTLNEKGSEPRATFSTPEVEKVETANSSTMPQYNGSQKRRRRGTTKSRRGFSASDDIISRQDAEALLALVQGSLVVFPYDWLKVEEHNSNWLYQVDQVAPLQIYD